MPEGGPYAADAGSGTLSSRALIRDRRTMYVVLALLVAAVGLATWFALRPLAHADDPLRWESFAPAADTAVRPWTHIVIHHSAAERGNVATIDRWHRSKGWDGIGYHVVVGNGRDMPLGAVAFTFRWRLQREGAHAGSGTKQHSFNELGLGLCLIGHFEKSSPDQWQLERTADLCAELIRHVPTISVGRIIAHRDVPGKETDCPGAQFDIEKLRFMVRQRL